MSIDECQRTCADSPFERAHEHGELQVGGRDAVRRDVDTGAVEHRLPVDELGRLGSPNHDRPSAGSASSSSR